MCVWGGGEVGGGEVFVPKVCGVCGVSQSHVVCICIALLLTVSLPPTPLLLPTLPTQTTP